jgi:anti-sigma regulatory factor (Ser/Thr protein kinase)
MPYIHCPTCGVSAYSAAAYSTTPVCAVCGTPISNGNGVAEVPGCLTLTREFIAAPGSIPDARHELESLEEELGEALHATVALLVSELVTNSVRHSGSSGKMIELHIMVTPESVRLRVSDEGTGFRPAGRTGEDSGWGLFMVEELADRWGVEARGGASVWFEIDRMRDIDEGLADLARAATAASEAPQLEAATNGRVIPFQRRASG